MLFLKDERYQLIARRFRRNKRAIASSLVIIFFAILAMLAPYLAPYDPFKFSMGEEFAAPSWKHPFGTDEFGRDVLSRVIDGTGMSLAFGFLAIALGLVGGIPIGLVSGYLGRRVDEVVMRLTDAWIAFPELILALMIAGILGPSFRNAVLAVGVVFIPGVARVVRSAVLALRELDFVRAAKASGESDLYIMVGEILPNCASPILVETTIRLAYAILDGASLSFLGLGQPPPSTNWGLMVSSGRAYLGTSPWIALFPGLAIGLLVLSFNLLGDAMRDILDPKVVSFRIGA